MRLLNIHTLKLEDFLGDVPPYAILSHTWGDGEVTLQDMDRHDLIQKPGWTKIVGFCQAVIEFFPEPLEYAWVDTCCIDKTSSAELSEAINAMFRWYEQAQCCFAYLEDVSHGGEDDPNPIRDDFEASRWFTRGWTLQELLAPQSVEFFDRKWTYLGNKKELAPRISNRTGIDEETLLGGELSSASVAQKMSWAASRQTTRLEDIAYCLLGIFGINMTMLYGEGENAFIRLQEEILKEYDDQSIFAWDSSAVPESVSTIGILATHPRLFKDCAAIQSHPSQGDLVVTNRGIQLDIPLIQEQSNPGQMRGLLSCYSQGDVALAVGIGLVQSSNRKDQYSRTRTPVNNTPNFAVFRPQKVYLTKRNRLSRTDDSVATACWLHFGSLEFIRCHPPGVWHRSSLTTTMTMNLGRATSEQVATRVIFKTLCSNSVCLVLNMTPSKRTCKLSLEYLQTKDDSSYTVTLLDYISTDPAAPSNKLIFPSNQVTAECKVELIRGSWMYNVSISQTMKKPVRIPAPLSSRK
ncbi:hypothetical protein G7Z17_g12166 [Cylindrodendrum hubeiense]|uniref:Heterokaryon incompatibility domain-containing protein n=1 Tax=Cylindrodendrum hubeiense TaxID=595255 RepID=A0A9P5GY77_9HYPO|nr:hypothetical protein G7Z17_g12166 [Cylindrodendrum hubeiense]